MAIVANEIKERIKAEIGEWLTVSIGIAPNRYLAKTAAGLHKPNGLDEINRSNFNSIYQNLDLSDLCGIKRQNEIRLNKQGIYSVTDFYQSSLKSLTAAFESIVGYYWYLRLHGWEIDDIDFTRKSFGNSYALPKPFQKDEELAPILMKLTQKMSERLRNHKYNAGGVHYSVLFRDGTHWHQGMKTNDLLFATNDIYRAIFKLYRRCPYRKPVANLAVSCFNLSPSKNMQLGLFNETLRKHELFAAVDRVNERYGNYVLTPAMMLGTENNVPDRIAFGGIKELEELIFAA
jgi:DNA polymerase-4